MKRYIENWKLCDYTYCPQIVNHLMEQEISIQEPRDTLIAHLESFLDAKKAKMIVSIVDENREAICHVKGVVGNSVYLLMDYGLSRSLIKEKLFEKIELETLLFMTLDEITKALDVSVYTGHKILEACRFALHSCVDDTNEKKKELLISDIREYFRGKKEDISSLALKQDLLFRSEESLLDTCLAQLIEKEEIELVNKGVYRNKALFVNQSLSEVIDGMHDQLTKEIVARRLYGETLQAIGSSLRIPLSEKRVGQIFRNELRCFPPVKEDKYLELISKYGLGKETFYEITGALEPTWGYIQYRFSDQLDHAKIALTGSVLSRLVCKELSISSKKLQAYMEKHYIHIQNQWVSKEDRSELLEAVCKSFDGYFQKAQIEKRFNKILDQYLPEKAQVWRLDDFHVHSVAKQGYLVHSPKRGMRYRVISENLVRSIIEEVHLAQYIDTIVSTKKIFEENIDVMEKYDIRDQYELHSLLRTGREKYNIYDNQMEVARMPMLQFGRGQENEIVKAELLQHAPIDVDDFARIMATKYGYDIRTFNSYLRRHFNVYIDENRIEIADAAVLESHDYKVLKGILHQDFYFMQDFEQLLIHQHLSTQLMDPYVLKRLGYRSYAGYLLKEPYSPAKYFETWIVQHIDEIEPRHFELSSFQFALSRLEEQMKIFEWDKNRYVTAQSLEISKDELKEFMDNIVSVLEDGQYFTEFYLAQHSIIDQPLSNTFYKSLFKSNPMIQMTSLGSTWVFKKSKQPALIKDFLVQIVQDHPGLTITSCLMVLKQWYNITLSRRSLQEKILESGLYYSLDTEKIYLEKPNAIFQQEALF